MTIPGKSGVCQDEAGILPKCGRGSKKKEYGASARSSQTIHRISTGRPKDKFIFTFHENLHAVSAPRGAIQLAIHTGA